ncbi:MAG: hypothetical protein IKI84_13430 [Clostridia bacterium]|nr:hypothetical protein [Clostridia bacterium]
MDDQTHHSAWYEITLLDCGPNKLDVIRLVREYRFKDPFAVVCQPRSGHLTFQYLKAFFCQPVFHCLS